MSDISTQVHPIEMTVSPDLRRTRLTVFFRLILVIPQAIWLGLWGLLVYICVIFAWFAALFTGKVPDGMHDFIASYLRCLTRVSAYTLLLSDPWPPFGGNEGGYPVDLLIAPPARQNRWITFFRNLLVIPALLLDYVFRLVNNMIAFLGWFVCLFTGQMNEGMQNLSIWLLRYEVQTLAYMLLLTDRYPSLSSPQ
jgi:Domain of unknown function (DUF4389)